jgi:glucokinase
MAKMAVGIDLGGTNLRVALVSQDGRIKELLREKTPVAEGPEATAHLMAAMIAKLQSKHGEILGIGIGSPGPISREEKMIFQTPNLPGFDGYPLGKKVESLTKLPLILEHDAKCAAYGERYFGVAKGVKNVVLMTFGTGIGGGIFVDGKMLYGKSDGAGEVGHMTLYPEGIPCLCGNRGCFERYVSASAVERRAKESTGKEWKNPEILEAAAQGVAWANDLMKKVSIDLAIGIASLVNIFEPDMVVLAGGLFTSGGGPICQMVSRDVEGRCFRSSQRNLQIVASNLNGDSGVLGAAGRVFELLND